jgi:hypothetical protein
VMKIPPFTIEVLVNDFNPLHAGLNPICHLLAILGPHPILHVSRIRVNVLEGTLVSNFSFPTYNTHKIVNL